MSVKTYPGADINSDHNPVVVDIKIRRFVKFKLDPRQKRIDIRKLKNPAQRTQISQKLENRLKEIERSIDNEFDENIESSWVLKKSLTTTRKTDIGFANNIKKHG
ncbi:hypothetical protein HHI36_018541, partial [Cryptolaemus montrouzieri]